ncbi:MAG: hypothetical protein H9W81_12870 [Enterococcus sp.]|nr:hypothetical protein [Enterococcus sp.]
MISRKEKAAQRKKAHKKRVVVISSVVGIASALVVLAFFFMSSGRNITAIEKVVSEDTDVLFVSKVEDGTWDYFMYMSGYTYKSVNGVETMGFANEESRSYLYLEGDTDKIKESLKEQNIIYGEKDGVIGIGEEGWNFSDKALSESNDYRKMATEPDNNATFAYIDFEALRSPYPESYYYAVPHLGKWYATYGKNKWSGETTVDRSRMDTIKMKDEVSRNPNYRNFINELMYKDNGWEVAPITLGLLADINYETNINLIRVELNGNTLSLNLGQE